MPDTVPTLLEFDRVCRDEFRFLLEDFGFTAEHCSTDQERFCIRFFRENQAIEIRGEGYGTIAACDVFEGDCGPLSLVFLVPRAARPKRSKKRDRMGQLDHVREWAQLARAHAADFFAGDVSRFRREWDTWRTTLANKGMPLSAQRTRRS
jgi:hypothetical protein